jgi:hypothetical protein
MKVRACGAKDYVHFCAEFIHVPSEFSHKGAQTEKRQVLDSDI